MPQAGDEPVEKVELPEPLKAKVIELFKKMDLDDVRPPAPMRRTCRPHSPSLPCHLAVPLLSPVAHTPACMVVATQDKQITKEEAKKHFKSFAKVNAEAMFNEVDNDKNTYITYDEFLDFWTNVLSSGYSAEEVQEEVENLMKGEAWRDWDDGRTT